MHLNPRRLWILATLLIGPTGLPAASSAGLSNFAKAKFVIGQANFKSRDCYQGGQPAANNLCEAEGAPSRRKKHLYIPDSGANRVLGFLKVPKKSNASADFVLGQPNLLDNNLGLDQSSFDFPARLATTRDQLFVADFDNDRVLIWNELPTITNTPADVVVGQGDFTSSDVTLPPTASSLNMPEGLAVGGGKLFVSDRENNRVLIWNSIPTTNGASADVVLGQSDFGSRFVATSQTGLSHPDGIWTDGQRLAVADTGNNRVIIWNSIPTTNGAPADVVVGQKNFNSAVTIDPPKARTLSGPLDVSSDGERLFVADSGNNRVLVYDPFPTHNHPRAQIVLGQPNFRKNDSDAGGSVSGRNFDFPIGVSFAGGKLFVTDFGNDRILVFNGKVD